MEHSNSSKVPAREQEFAALVAQVPPGELAQVLADVREIIKLQKKV